MFTIDDIVANLIAKTALSVEQQQQLRNILTSDNVLVAINTGILKAEELLSPATPLMPSSVLPISKISQLVAACDTALSNASIKEKKIPLLFWLRDNLSFYLYILSTSNLLALTTTMDAANFAPYLEQNIDATKEWDNIREELKNIGDLLPSHFKEKKIRAETVSKRLQSLNNFIQRHPILLAEYLDVATAIFQYINANPEPLESAAKQYFEALFTKENKTIQNINFFTKAEGIQLGRKMVINYIHNFTSTSHTISYFIKTHQYGSTSCASSTKTVDPKELFIYKVMAYMGFGPKVHFFFNPLSHGGFYIATQDASFTKSVDKIKKFDTYDRIKDSLNKAENASSVKLDTQISLTRMDILSRIFRLHDITTNPGNFGRVTVNEVREKWKILDFRIDTMASYLYNDIFGGFLSGNGMYNYDGYLGILIRDTPIPERLHIAKLVIAQLENGLLTQNPDKHKIPLISAVEIAAAETLTYVGQNNEALKIQPSSISDFNRYVDAVKRNYAELKAAILSQPASVRYTLV